MSGSGPTRMERGEEGSASRRGGETGRSRSARGGTRKCFGGHPHLLAKSGNTGHVLNVVQDAGAERGLSERVHGGEDRGIGAHGDLLEPGGLLGGVRLAQVAALAVSGGLTGSAALVGGRAGSGRSAENLGGGTAGRRAVGWSSREKREWDVAHLFWLLGDEKHSGAGDRAGSAVSAAACASLTPWARSAREGVMGERALAKSKKGDDKSDACVGRGAITLENEDQISREDSGKPQCGRVASPVNVAPAYGATSAERIASRKKREAGKNNVCFVQAYRVVRVVRVAPGGSLGGEHPRGKLVGVHGEVAGHGASAIWLNSDRSDRSSVWTCESAKTSRPRTKKSAKLLPTGGCLPRRARRLRRVRATGIERSPMRSRRTAFLAPETRVEACRAAQGVIGAIL